jgi:hypothetical protein
VRPAPRRWGSIAAQHRLRLLVLPLLLVTCLAPALASAYFGPSAAPVSKVVGTLEVGHYDDLRLGTVQNFSRVVTKTERTEGATPGVLRSLHALGRQGRLQSSIAAARSGTWSLRRIEET